MSFGKIALKSFIFSLSVVFIFTAILFSDRPVQGALPGVSNGNAAPDFELKDLNDASVKLSAYKGKKPVLIYFWATWCPYCMEIRSEVVKLSNNIPKADLEVLAVNVGGADSLARVKKFDQKYPAPYTILYDGQGDVPRAYQVQGIPLFILVDKSGTIKYRSTDLPLNVKELLK